MEAARIDLVLRTGRMPPADADGSGRGMNWDDDNREALVSHLTAVFDLEGPILEPELGDPAVGREVFATHCAACHGYSADGGVAGAGALTPRLVGVDPVVLAESVRFGPFQMPAFAEEQISDDEIGDIAAYLDVIAEEETTLLGLGELNPVFVGAFVALLVVAMVLSCLWISGRVAMFPDPEESDEPEAAEGDNR
jgi:ubiquinol-cytochrome c reductase cytochrome c subunit